LISDILLELDKIEFSLVDYNQDILGDVYEYLISQFASSAGKKAGEFYTPQQVSKILSSITLGSVKNAKEIYDPTCGSGSLLLGLLREDKKIKSCYGQESTGTTYNLCKMNMILNGLHYRRFNIKHDDTLEKPQHMDKEFDIIVSNPPFSSKWKPNASLINDIRFKPYGVLAPDSKADYAFVAHMLHHLKRDGIMCVILSRGSLYREGVETNLKKALIEKYNYLDGIIGLPKNIFYISKAPTCILIFKKNRKTNEKIIFIEAAKLYKKAPKRNLITDEHISQITDIYLERKEIKKLSKNIDKKEIFENNFNLNISKYIDGTVELPNQDIKKIILDFKKNNELYNQNEKELFKICEKLKLPFPDTNNVNLLYNYKEAFRNDLFNKKINLGENIKWGDLNLSDLLQETFQKTIDKNEEIYSVSVHKGLVNQIEHLGRSFAAENTLNYNLVKPGDIVYTRSPTGEFPFGVIKQSKIYKSVLVSPLYGVYKPSTIELGNIIDFYFELKENAYNYLHSIVNIGPKNTISISSDVFLSKKITVPEDTEIIKLISLFINLLNKKINLIYEKN